MLCTLTSQKARPFIYFQGLLSDFLKRLLSQDPALRPSAKGLLAHPFLAGPHDSGKLAELVQRHAEKRRDASMLGGRDFKQGAAGDGEPSRWDFGTTVANRGILPDLTPRGSIKSHQINSFTIRDTTWGDTFAQRQLQQGVRQFVIFRLLHIRKRFVSSSLSNPGWRLFEILIKQQISLISGIA